MQFPIAGLFSTALIRLRSRARRAAGGKIGIDEPRNAIMIIVAMTTFDHDALVLTMLGLVLFLTAVFLVFLWMIHHSARRMARAYCEEAARKPASWKTPRGRFRPLFYHQPERWLAVRCVEMELVGRALGLSNTARCSWHECMTRGGERAIFLTPPVMGWVLAIGPGLPDPADDVDACYHFLAQLSRSVGEIQYFNVHPALHHHAWVKANGGEIQRAYAWAGETVWSQGAPTKAEIELGMRFFDYADPSGSMLAASASAATNVERLPALAARWSINPAGIDERILDNGRGIAGEASPVRPM